VRYWFVLVALALSPLAPMQPPPRTFKVATWNIRSGMGIRGFATTSWNSTTLNCTDSTKPMNAWGMGLPQKELARIKADTAIVALAVQEAWNCGSPRQINSILGFKTASREQEGAGLLARYGFAGEPVYHRIDATYNRWLVGGRVCLDAGCHASLSMFSTHFGGASDDDFATQARRVVETLGSEPVPHLFMGDLNIFRIDRWNPAVPCTAKDSIGRIAAIDTIEKAGYQDAWKATQTGEGWSGMSSRKGCGSPAGSLYKRIDYVFSKGIAPGGVTRFAQVAPGADAPSDHAGLIAEFPFPVTDAR
jgi:endonuclease/exonuclease/phosphatase family metal-dependent hydrolase